MKLSVKNSPSSSFQTGADTGLGIITFPCFLEICCYCRVVSFLAGIPICLLWVCFRTTVTTLFRKNNWREGSFPLLCYVSQIWAIIQITMGNESAPFSRLKVGKQGVDCFIQLMVIKYSPKEKWESISWCLITKWLWYHIKNISYPSTLFSIGFKNILCCYNIHCVGQPLKITLKL